MKARSGRPEQKQPAASQKKGLEVREGNLQTFEGLSWWGGTLIVRGKQRGKEES